MGMKGLLMKGACAAVAAAAVCISFAGIAGSAGASGIPTGGTKVSGGTVRWAEPPGTPPTYIFPFMSGSNSGVNDVQQLQYMLYRPLYVFGHPTNTNTTLNPTLSLASVPAYSNGNTEATVALKNYKWSDGETVTATDVLFFMNMLHAETAGLVRLRARPLPRQRQERDREQPVVDHVHVQQGVRTDVDDLQRVLPDHAVPDGLGHHGHRCGVRLGRLLERRVRRGVDRRGVRQGLDFLSGQANDLTSYSTSPIWGIVDGPYTIAASKGGSFQTTGQVTMVPNPSYSGPQKATVTVIEEPYTTDNAEFDALLGNNLDIGYAPQQDITKPTTNASIAGTNNPRLTNFYLTPWILFGFNYAVLKFDSTGDGGNAGAIYKQLYVRQAMQSVVDQPAMIQKFLAGYGVPTYGPVPVLPKNDLVDSYEKSNPYPYNPAHAESLLKSHGWKVVPNGIDTCEKPGTGPSDCGAGIPQGAQLNFTMVYVSGTQWQQQVMDVEQSAWNAIGIKTQLVGNTFPTVISSYAPPCMTGRPARSRKAGGAEAGSTARTTTRRVRPCSPPVRAATPATTATPRPTP